MAESITQKASTVQVDKGDWQNYDPSEADQKYLLKATRRFGIASSYWQSWIDWNRSLLLDYDMEFDLLRDKKGNVIYPFRSRIFSPLSREKIDVMVPLVVSMILDHDPPFTAVAGHPGQDPRKVKKTEALLAYQLRNRGFKEDVIHIVQQVLKMGSQIVRLRWRYEAKYITRRYTREFLGIPLGVDKKRELVLSYNGPDFVRVPFYRFFIDPNTPPCELQRAQYICEENVLSWNDFLDDAEYLGYENLEYVEAAVSDPRRQDEKGPPKGTGPQKGSQDSRDIPGDEYARDVRVLYYYDHTDVITVAMVPGRTTGGILLKREAFAEKCPNLEYPYVAIFETVHADKGAEAGSDAATANRPGGFYPTGELAPLHGLQRAHNATINQRIDNVTLGLRAPMIVMGNALEDEEKLALGWIQNPVMHARAQAGMSLDQIIRFVQFPDMFGAGWAQQEQTISAMAVKASHTYDTMAGNEDPKNQTAAGIMQLTSNAMKPMLLKVFIMTKLGFEKLLTAMSDMNSEMIDPLTEAYATGEDEAIYINPEEVVMGLAYSIRTVPPYNKQLMALNAQELAPQFEKYYPLASAKRFMEIIAENQEWLENAEELIPKYAPDLNFLQVKMLAEGIPLEVVLGRVQAPIAAGGEMAAPNMQGGGGAIPPEMDAEAEVRAAGAGAPIS